GNGAGGGGAVGGGGRGARGGGGGAPAPAGGRGALAFGGGGDIERRPPISLIICQAASLRWVQWMNRSPSRSTPARPSASPGSGLTRKCMTADTPASRAALSTLTSRLAPSASVKSWSLELK